MNEYHTIFHFSPAASFDKKFLFHPKMQECTERVYFFSVGRSGFLNDRSSLWQIGKEYYRAIGVLLKGLGEKNRRSIAYCHSTLYAWPALLLCRLFGVGEVVYFNHGVPYIGHKGWTRIALKIVDRLNVAIGHNFMTVSPGMVNYLKLNVEPLKHSTYPGSSSGLRPSNFIDRNKANSKWGRSYKNVRFLYAGRLQERKGIVVLLEAWQIHIQHYPDDELWLCGFSEIEFSGLGDRCTSSNIFVHGYVNDMKRIYDQVDVVISASFHEGFGYTLLEGAARGCCIISSDIPGPDVLFTKCMQGQTFTVGSAESLAALMGTLSGSPITLAIAKLLSYRSACRFVSNKISFPHLPSN
jgi:glycosyltransferase involved in cell wall biosynthesis